MAETERLNDTETETEMHTETEISAETDTETESFRSLISMLIDFQQPEPNPTKASTVKAA